MLENTFENRRQSLSSTDPSTKDTTFLRFLPRFLGIQTVESCFSFSSLDRNWLPIACLLIWVSDLHLQTLFSLQVMVLTTKWHRCASFEFSAIPLLKHRKRIGGLKVASAAQSPSEKKANLSAAKRERIELPSYRNDHGNDKLQIGEFLSHPSAIEALLNTNALKSFQCLGLNTYRCTLQQIRLLSFEAAPVLDLRVTPTADDCTVEMLSCKFKGSEIMEQQNSHFSAFMRNHMTWDTDVSQPFLEVDVTLNLTLEIYTLPFTMMPVSAVEGPGNLMLQALLDRLVPLLLQQLLQDYGIWVRRRRLDLIP